MNPQDYLDNKLKDCGHYDLGDSDDELIANQGMEAFIYTKLTSKKFRKWKVDEGSEQQAKRAIHINVAANEPLQFRFPFGGYKLWRIETAPEVDWAEFFTVAYYAKYLAPIAAAYEPGLELVFASDDVIIERMDNIPAADTDAYFNSFQILLENFSKYLPANLGISIMRIGDLYSDKNVMEEELAANIEKVRAEYGNSDETHRNKMLITSELNINWDGAKDLKKIPPEEKQKIIEMGPIYHDAYGALSKRREFNRGDDKIVIFTTPIPNAIAIGTTKSSVTKFWTGCGVLEKVEAGYRDRILSPKQIEGIDGFKEERVELIPLRNLDRVRILN